MRRLKLREVESISMSVDWRELMARKNVGKRRSGKTGKVEIGEGPAVGGKVEIKAWV